jgi:hypothetical protein
MTRRPESSAGARRNKLARRLGVPVSLIRYESPVAVIAGLA